MKPIISGIQQVGIGVSNAHGTEAQEQVCFKSGYPLTVNSYNSFDLGNAAGHFAYNEDPDGTLVEYVETYKVPVVK